MFICSTVWLMRSNWTRFTSPKLLSYTSIVIIRLLLSVMVWPKVKLEKINSFSQKYLGAIVFNVIVHFFKSLDWTKGREERQGLGRRSPVGFRVSGVDQDVEQQDDDVGGDGRAVVHQEHDGQTNEGPQKWEPAIVIFKCWPPSRWSTSKQIKLK